jgi:hypothetical protein
MNRVLCCALFIGLLMGTVDSRSAQASANYEQPIPRQPCRGLCGCRPCPPPEPDPPCSGRCGCKPCPRPPVPPCPPIYLDSTLCPYALLEGVVEEAQTVVLGDPPGQYEPEESCYRTPKVGNERVQFRGMICLQDGEPSGAGVDVTVRFGGPKEPRTIQQNRNRRERAAEHLREVKNSNSSRKRMR